MTRRVGSVTGCDCRHRKEPLAISIVIKIEHDRPELALNSSTPGDDERMMLWLRARPRLLELVARADELAREEQEAA